MVPPSPVCLSVHTCTRNVHVCVYVYVCMFVCVCCDQERVSQGEAHLLHNVLASEISPNVETSIVWFVIVGVRAVLEFSP